MDRDRGNQCAAPPVPSAYHQETGQLVDLMPPTPRQREPEVQAGQKNAEVRPPDTNPYWQTSREILSFVGHPEGVRTLEVEDRLSYSKNPLNLHRPTTIESPASGCFALYPPQRPSASARPSRSSPQNRRSMPEYWAQGTLPGAAG